jgi:hypothetical protein
MVRMLIFFLCCICTECFGQTQVKRDTAFVEERSFSTSDINSIKQDKDFQYDRFKEPPESLWDRFWGWVWFKIKELLSTKAGRTSVWTVFILFGVCVIGYFVFKVMGMNKGGLFGRSSSQNLNYTTSSEDIHGISFDEAIQQAIDSSNFRLAVRLLYLQSLKKLSDAGYINWQLNKTNTDYLHETKDKTWHALFSSLTYNFEYTWYGETPVDKDNFHAVQQRFLQFNKQL